MDILPAIDLKDGKAVRLSKGLMDSAKIYSNEPWMVAKRFEELGSKWVHIVDLNGAFEGKPANLEQIKKIRENCNLKIPHMGWNKTINKDNPLFKNLQNPYLYFVHSYHVITDDKYTIATTNYGYDFVSAVNKDNIFGFQPHPEKSHNNGLKILENFINLQ